MVVPYPTGKARDFANKIARVQSVGAARPGIRRRGESVRVMHKTFHSLVRNLSINLLDESQRSSVTCDAGD